MHGLLKIAINDDGDIVSIYNVPTGIKCNCKCPECGGQLEAKNNGKSPDGTLNKNQKTAHFAHADGKFCSWAPESEVHLLAKKVLTDNKKLMLPEYKVWGVFLLGSQTYIFDEVIEERNFKIEEERVRPDATLKKGNTFLFIEFYKTNPVDLKKKEKLKKIGISTIEINLKHIVLSDDIDTNYKAIKTFLEESTEHKEWIFHRRRNEFFTRLGKGQIS